MAIVSHNGLHTPVCDMCGEDLPGETDFYDAVRAKKHAGWKSRRVKGEWEDVCCDCLERESEARKGKGQ